MFRARQIREYLSHEENRYLILAVVAMGALIVFLYSVRITVARDLGQWENADPVVRQWYKSLMRPDEPTSSCCGEADAYWCDDISVRNGKTYCRITDPRPDGPLGRPHREIGEEFEIPPEKLKWDAGNPTGHYIIFLRADGYVWCFVQAGGV